MQQRERGRKRERERERKRKRKRESVCVRERLYADWGDTVLFLWRPAPFNLI